MIRKDGTELDLEMLDTLCRQRKIQCEQKMRDEINSKLIQITRSCNPPSGAVTRSYGVEQEGEANDVWHHILRRITDPTDVKKLWEVSGMFRDILRGKYMETKLPEVVKLILDKHPEWTPVPVSDNEKATFLKLRLISKQCNKSVEDICHSEKCYMPHLNLNTIESVQGICGKFARNPSIAASSFPSFKVILDEYEMPADNLEEFRRASTDFLGLFGHRIWHFRYYFQQTSEEMYQRLREWTSFLPNMEFLAFAPNGHGDEDAPELEEIEPFPHLPKLRCIREAGALRGVLSTPFVQRILEACPGIEDLQLNEGDHVREHSTQVLANLSNLTSIQVCPYRSLLLRRNLPWKLKKLILYREDLTFVRNEPTIKTTVSSCRLFAFLKQFEDTLEYLELDMVDVVDGCGYLELRNLKALKMELHESYDNLDFLFYAEKLESLKVRIGDEYMWHLSAEEKFSRIISGSFLGKSVWDVFPYLKRFQLRTTDYSEWNGKVYGAKFEELRKVS